MKTSVMEVRDMLSVLSVLGVEERIGKVPGVESVTVNFAAGNATVRYDETRLEIADIKSAVRQNGYESDAPSGASAGKGHNDHATASVPPTDSASQDNTAPDVASSTPTKTSAARPTAAPTPTPAVPESAPDDAAAPAPAAVAGDDHPDKS